MKIRVRLGGGLWHGDQLARPNESRTQVVDLSALETALVHQQMDADMRDVLRHPDSLGAWRLELLAGYSKTLRDSAALRGRQGLGQAYGERPAILRELRSRLLLARCASVLGRGAFEW